jgi:hypothetical protein
LKKRTKKLLSPPQPRGAPCITHARRQGKKFFASFFQKRSPSFFPQNAAVILASTD